MALWQGKSKRKPTGGRLVQNRKKRRFEVGREPLFTNLGPESLRKYRTMGGNSKNRMLSAAYANVVDPATNKVTRVRILKVVQNTANPNYVQRNIMNRGVHRPDRRRNGTHHLSPGTGRHHQRRSHRRVRTTARKGKSFPFFYSISYFELIY